MFEQCQTKGLLDLYNCLIQHKKKLLGEQTLWSLSEVKASQEDYEILCQWWKNYTEKNFNYHNETNPKPLGLLLLLLITENLKRNEAAHKNEHNVWPVIRDFLNDKNPLITPIVFSKNGTGSANFKELLRGTALQYELRNTFQTRGINGNRTQPYYSLFKLQIGWRWSGIKQKLPLWLSRYGLSDSIQDLRGVGSDAKLQSATFIKLWNTLVHFRYGEDGVNEQKVRKTLEESPWVLAEWREEIIELAQKDLNHYKRITDPTTNSKESYAHSQGEIIRGTHQETVLIKGIHLQIANGQPKFCITMNTLADCGYNSGTFAYYCQIGDKAMPVNGSVITISAIELAKESQALLPIIHVVKDGNSVRQETVFLWDDENFPIIYDCNLKRRLRWTEQLNKEHSLCLIVPADIDDNSLKSGLTNCTIYTFGDKKICAVPPNWSVINIDDLGWYSSGRPIIPDKWQTHSWFIPAFENDHIVELATCDKNDNTLDYKFNLLPNTRIEWVRTAQESERTFPEPEHDLLQIQPFPHLLKHQGIGKPAIIPLTFRVIEEHGSSKQSFVLKRDVEAPVKGVAWFHYGSWKTYNKNESLNKADAEITEWRFFLPYISASAKISIFEGARYVCDILPNGTLRSITNLNGYGEPLTIKSDNKRVIIVQSVHDKGILKTSKIDDAGHYVLTLRYKIAQGEHHKIYCWIGEECLEYDIDVATEPSDVLKTKETVTEKNIHAVGVCFHRDNITTILGSDWNEKEIDTFACNFVNKNIGNKPIRKLNKLIKGVVRYIKLPILQFSGIHQQIKDNFKKRIYPPLSGTQNRLLEPILKSVHKLSPLPANNNNQTAKQKKYQHSSQNHKTRTQASKKSLDELRKDIEQTKKDIAKLEANKANLKDTDASYSQNLTYIVEKKGGLNAQLISLLKEIIEELKKKKNQLKSLQSSNSNKKRLKQEHVTITKEEEVLEVELNKLEIELGKLENPKGYLAQHLKTSQ